MPSGWFALMTTRAGLRRRFEYLLGHGVPPAMIVHVRVRLGELAQDLLAHRAQRAPGNCSFRKFELAELIGE